MTASVKRNRWTEMWKINIPGFEWLTGKQHCWGEIVLLTHCVIICETSRIPPPALCLAWERLNGRVNIYKFGWFLWLYSRKWQHRITLVDFFFLKEHQAKRKNDQKAPRYILQYFLFSNKHKETVSTMNEFNVVLNEDDVRTLGLPGCLQLLLKKSSSSK